jgi:tripartite-type tricarboxylate transporter receptor subunit TctC
LPTVSDSGIPGYEFTSWLGLLGPAALPHAVIDRIELEMRKLLLSSTIVERLDRQGVDTEILNINQFGDRLRKEQLHWAEIIKRSGAMLD